MSEKIKIFRVHHPESGEGAYGTSVDWFSTAEGYPGGINHPAPGEDPGLREFWTNAEYATKTTYYFGFASLEQYEKWFFMLDWREAMHKAGLKLVTFEVDAKLAVVGTSQAVFVISAAEVVDTQDLI